MVLKGPEVHSLLVNQAGSSMLEPEAVVLFGHCSAGVESGLGTLFLYYLHDLRDTQYLDDRKTTSCSDNQGRTN